MAELRSRGVGIGPPSDRGQIHLRAEGRFCSAFKIGRASPGVLIRAMLALEKWSVSKLALTSPGFSTADSFKLALMQLAGGVNPVPQEIETVVNPADLKRVSIAMGVH